MKLDKTVACFLAALAAALLAHAAFAGDGKWIYDPAKGTSPANATLWSDPSNWTNGVIPSAKADRADLREATNRYIRIDTDLELYQLRGCSAGRTVIMGGGKLTLWGTAKYPNVISDNAIYYVPVALKDSIANAWERFENNYMAADFTLLNGGFQNPYNSTWFHSDWYADSSDPVRTNGIVFATSGYHMNVHYAGYHFYGPEGLAEAATSTWKLTAGSPFATPVGETGHALPPGTLVSAGDSLPEGTFLRRVYPDGTIELSAAATGDATGETEVTFAAFTAQVTYRIDGFGRSVGGWYWTDVNKSRDEDDLRVVIEAFNSTGENYPYGFTCAAGKKPGTVVVRNGTRNNLWIGVRGGRIEFAGKDALGTDAGIPNGVLTGGNGASDSDASKSTSYVVVTNGITARVGRLEYVLGKFVKEGGGTLIAGLSTSANSVRGTFVAQEGTLAFPDADDGAFRSISTLAISNGATLKVPATGLKITGTLTQELGAVITGPGLLALPDSADLSAYTVDDNVLLVHVSQTGFAASDYTWDEIPAAASPLDEGLPAPASWMDASVASSLVTQEDAKQLSLLTWKDVRGDGYPYAVHTGTDIYPEVVTNKAGESHHVYIAHVESYDVTKLRALKYDKNIANVKAVFKAFNGCGQFIGATANTYMRTSGGYSISLFYNGGSSSSVPGTFYVNGEVRNQKKGFPYQAQNATDKSRFDPQVGEFHFTTSVPTISHIGDFADNSKDRNGGDRICEMLVYTNALTFVQRQKICAYLMKKWMHGAEASVDYGAIANRFVSTDAGGTVPVADGQATVFESVAGSGTLAKMGAGTMYVKDLANADGGLVVADGTVRINSTALTREALPGDPYYHMDGSDSSSAEFLEGSTEKIVKMNDVRGAGHVSATVLTEGKYPTIKKAQLNGLDVVDFGDRLYQRTAPSDLCGLVFPETDHLYSIFRVVGGYGGVLSGYIGPEKTTWEKGGELHSIHRTGGGYYDSYPWLSANANVYAMQLCTVGSHSAGGTTFRMDGLDLNPTSTNSVPANVYKLIVLNGFDHIYSDALGCHYGSQGYYWGGGQPTGEAILYTNALSRSSALKVEAYLNKKWFGKDTPGFRPAETGSLAVDAGATLDIVGGAPVSVSSLACAGHIAGGVAVRAGGEIDAVFGEGGTLVPFDITEGVDCSAGGTVVVSGDLRGLKGGDYPIAALAAGTSVGAWTVSFGEVTKIPNGEFSVGEADGKLVLRFVPPGLLLLVR